MIRYLTPFAFLLAQCNSEAAQNNVFSFIQLKGTLKHNVEADLAVFSMRSKQPTQQVPSAAHQQSKEVPTQSAPESEPRVQDLHRAVLGMPPAKATAAPVLHSTQAIDSKPKASMLAVSTHLSIPPSVANSQTSASAVNAAANAATVAVNAANDAGNAAANAATVAVNAANAAVAAANTAAEAAVSANVAATVAADVNSAASSESLPASVNAVTDAANAAMAAANTAANAAASANIAANAAASANSAANAAATASSSAHDHVAVPTPAQVPATSATALDRATIITESTPAVAQVPATSATSFDPATIESPSGSWSTPQWYMTQMTGLFTGLTFTMFVKALCVTGNVLVQVSPFPSVRRWEMRGDTGEADAAPYVSIAFGGCQWCFYGLFAWLVTSRSGFLVLVHSNVLGAVLGTYYVTAFFRNCHNEEAHRTLQRYVSAVLALACLQVSALSVLPSERALFLIGVISSFCSFINATSVLVTVPAVIRTKDSRSIPGPYAIANCASSLCWSLCGYLLEDPCVMMPNIFSTCCAGASLVLKAVYPAKEDDKLASAEEGRKGSTLRPAKTMPGIREPLKHSLGDTSGGTFSDESVNKGVEVLADPAVMSKHTDEGNEGTGGTC
jgi:uncharacterized protein with PQ loop repeat